MHPSLMLAVLCLLVSTTQCTNVTLDLGTVTMICENDQIYLNGNITGDVSMGPRTCAVVNQSIYENCEFLRNFTSEDKKKLKEFDDAVQKWFNDFTQYIEQQNEKLEKQLQVLHERFKNQKEGKEGEGWLQVQEEENHNYLTRLRKSLKQWQDLRRRKPLHGRRHWGHHEKRRRRRPKFHRRGNRQNAKYRTRQPGGEHKYDDFHQRSKRSFNTPYPEFPNFCEKS